MAESQYFFWIWNRLGKNQDEKVEEDPPAATQIQEDPAPTIETDDVESGLAGKTDDDDVDVGAEADEEADAPKEPLSTEEEELPAYMVDDDIDDINKVQEEEHNVDGTTNEENAPSMNGDDIDVKNNQEDDEERPPSSIGEVPIDYNTATMSTVKDNTVLRKKHTESPPGTPFVSELTLFKGEFTDCAEYLVHRETKEKFQKKKTDWKCICLSLLCFLAILLVATVILIAVVYLRGSLNDISETGLLKTTRAPGITMDYFYTIHTPPIQLIMVNVSLGLDKEWLSIYYPSSSPHYQKLENDIRSLMDVLFNESSRVKDVYERTEIDNFSPGPGDLSVKASLIVYVHDSPIIIRSSSEQRPQNQQEILALIGDELEQLISDIFTDVSNVQWLDTIDYINGSIEINEPLIILGMSTTISSAITMTTRDIRITTELQVTEAMSSTTPQCSTYEFTCANGRCIHLSDKCNGEDNCGDNSDEDRACDIEASTSPTSTNPQTDACESFEFECDNKECIYFFSECDGIQDCTDNSDESKCDDIEVSPSPTATNPQPSACESYEFECDNGECVYFFSECDGTQDCTDNSDESNCDDVEVSPSPTTTNPQPSACESYEFECDNGECVHLSSECNGKQDCTDNSDESNCNDDGCVRWAHYTDVPCWFPYNYTYFPNFISRDVAGFENITSAELNLRLLYRSRGCDRNALALFCGAVFPGCPTEGQSGTLAICRRFCERIAAKSSTCVDAFSGVNLNLTTICSSLPEVPIDESGEFCRYS